MKEIDTAPVTAGLRRARLLSMRMRRAFLAWLSTCASALQQPSIQYHIALLLTTLLAFFLGWSLFLSTVPHPSLACIRYW